MQGIEAATLTVPERGPVDRKAFANLGSQDFLSLLVTQLTTQDPLQPMSNQELLSQISSVRDIELSSTLTDSLRSLAGQERFGSASSLIGQYVTGRPGQDGQALAGLVTGVRFGQDGAPVLRLSDGSEMPIDEVDSIEPPARVADRLVGQAVVGVDRRAPSNPKVVRGVVTGIRNDLPAGIFLELDTGQDLRFQDVLSLADPNNV